MENTIYISLIINEKEIKKVLSNIAFNQRNDC